jgi:hypothetical protein
MNEQFYWDHDHWSGRRRWNGASWVDLPIPEGSGAGTAATNSASGPRAARPSPGSPRAWNGRRFIVLTISAMVIGLAIAIPILMVSSPASHPEAHGFLGTSTTVPTSINIQAASSAEVASCEADARNVEVALQAYNAQTGAYPSPSAPWSATTYAQNYSPLGRYLNQPPSPRFYVIEYDSSGRVWVAPPGSYGDGFNPGQAFEQRANVCLAAVQ